MTLGVLHLVGSPVSEFFAGLSRLYAEDCLRATADPGRYRFRIAYVSPGGAWCFPEDLRPASIAAAPSMSCAEAVGHLVGLGIDVVVPQMFCIPGMTAYRALFDLLAIPYVGNTPDVMALGADKVKSRAVVAAAGVAIPAGETVRVGGRPSLPPPTVVKPVDADNSAGVRLVRHAGEYDEALASALAHSDTALVEAYVELGREVRCGIVVDGGRLVCLPLEEYNVDPVHKPIRGYDDKLALDETGDLLLVAKDRTRSWIVDPSDPLTEVVWDAARRCHTALGCRHYSLFDFRIDPAGRPWFLEAGLYCSFADKSVVSVMATAAGIPLDALFATAIREATGV